MDKRRFIGEQIRRARVPRTQEKVARDITEGFGVYLSQRMLSDIETGKRDLSAEELDALSRYFGKSPSYFLRTPEEMVQEKTASYTEERRDLERIIASDGRLSDNQKDLLLRLIKEFTRQASA